MREGWNRWLSQLRFYSEWPRQIIGKTKNNFFVFTIDGRSSNESGATIMEMAKIVKEEVTSKINEEVEYALNLDGGSSSQLNYVNQKGDLVLLNTSSSGPDTILNVRRQTNSMLIIGGENENY